MTLLAGFSLLIWIYLIVGRDGFWCALEREDGAPAPEVWPSVVAVIPARDEAEGIGETVGSLLRQDYPGAFRIALVDDESSDDTSGAARRAAEAAGGAERLTILPGAPLPLGWTGKLWALSQGIETATRAKPAYLLLTDADIAYQRDALTRLVSRAMGEGLAMNSLMARLRCETLAERATIPAFILFFQMLYPFAAVNDPRGRVAAAAGGCMLIEREALEAVGGVAAIRGALIDDCALAALLKRRGPIRLSLASRVRSLRAYSTLGEIRRMIVRSAYAQLKFSPALLALTIAAMLTVFVAPVGIALFGQGLARALAALSWALMAVVFQPTLRDYRVSSGWGPLLPAIAGLYLAFTVESAWQSSRGRGGLWKGRFQERSARGVSG